jgi:hypothetical protein
MTAVETTSARITQRVTRAVGVGRFKKTGGAKR